MDTNTQTQEIAAVGPETNKGMEAAKIVRGLADRLKMLADGLDADVRAYGGANAAVVVDDDKTDMHIGLAKSTLQVGLDALSKY